MTAVIITGQERWARTGPSGNSDNYWGGGGGGGQHTPDSGQLSSMSACPAHEYIILTYIMEESC